MLSTPRLAFLATFASLALLAGLLLPVSAAAQHTVEVGAGWQNAGATRELTWEPAVQGSRKDVPVHLGWRYQGTSRVYYAPFARVQYTNFWSLGGAGNLLGLDLGLGGVGLYLSDPLDEVPASERVGHWFFTAEVNLANLRIGFNMTPDAPTSDAVPDPDAYRAEIRRQQNAGEDVTAHEQRYPFGGYSYVQVAFPVRLSAWCMIEETLGAGFFLESTVGAMEWPLDRPVTHLAYDYSVIAGATLHFFPGS